MTAEITKINLAGADKEIQELLENDAFRSNAERLVSLFLEDQSGNEWQVSFVLEDNNDRDLGDDITLFFAEGFFSSLLEHSGLADALKDRELSDEEIQELYDNNEMSVF
jgi:hypothetical protein